MVISLWSAVRRCRVQRYWSKAFAAGGIQTWAVEPVCRRWINRRISGSEDVWPIEWFAAKVGEQPFQRALSLGCGEGALERDLMTKGLCRSIEALDLSESALELARKRAAEAGLSGTHYRQANLDELELEPEAYDAIFVHQALHHVRALEHCLEEVRRALVPSGIFYLDEYVGPSRHEWRRELIAVADEVYAALPRHCRRRRHLQLPVDRGDPSEGVRAGEILPLLERSFRIEEKRDYGGNLLAVIYPHLSLDHLEPTVREELLRELLEREDELLAAGAPSFYSILVTRPA